MGNNRISMEMTNLIQPIGETIDGDDLEFLSSAMKPHDIIAIPVGSAPSKRSMQEAFARAVLGGWISLMDIGLVPDPRGPQFPPLLQRVFRLTLAGNARLAQLRGRAS